MKGHGRVALLGFLVGTLLLAGSGCAVLTQSQIDEVKRFGEAAQGYKALPGGVIDAYADTRFSREILSASTVQDPQEYLSGVNRAIAFRDMVRAQTKRANDALAVLDVYAAALATLTSNQPTDALTKSATSFGKAIDSAVTQYNKQYGASFGLFGGTAAAIVRGIGGIYIRHKQAELLREYVTAADPIVQQLTKDVDALTGVFREGERNVGSLAYEERQYEQLAKGTAGLKPGSLPLSTSLTVAETLKKIHDSIGLADSVPKASQAYRDAHSRLRGVVATRMTLNRDIEEITTLVNEIKAAQALLKGSSTSK